MDIKGFLEEIRPKKLDWYIMRRFITTFFVALLLIIVIVIIFDISEKVDDFVSKQVPLKEIVFDYYLNFIPYFMNMFAPLFVFITVIFFTSRLAANSEIIAILSCGISFNRLLRPYIMSAAFIFLVSLSFNLWLIPYANKGRMKFETAYVKSYDIHETGLGRNRHYQIAPGEFVFFESFSEWNNTAYKFTLEKIENNELTSKLTAAQATWDSTKCAWTLKNWFIRDFDASLENQIRSGRQMDTVLNITIGDFKKTRDFENQLSWGELKEYIATKKSRGDADIHKAVIERYTRFSMPFSAFILTIMGVSLSSRKRRGGTGWNLALGIGLSFSYILFMKFSNMFVFTDALPPALALWLPNIIFAGIAVGLYRLAPK